MKSKHIGSSLEDFLAAEGVLEETRALVIEEVIARQAQLAANRNNLEHEQHTHLDA